MATIYAMAGDRDWSDTGSFNTGITGGGSSGLPVSGDTLIVPYETRVTAGHTGLAGVDLAACYVTGNLTGTSSISLDVSNGSGVMVVNNRTGTLKVTSAGSGIDSLTFAPTSGGAVLELTSGTVPILIHIGGQFICQSSGVVTTYHKSGGTTTFYDGATAITTLNHTGGSMDCRRNVTTANNHGGASLVVNGDGVLATINNSGTINDRSSGVPTTLNMFGGVYNPAGSPVARTITTVNRYGGSVVTRVGSRDMLAFGTDNNYTGRLFESVSSVPIYSDAGGLLSA